MQNVLIVEKDVMQQKILQDHIKLHYSDWDVTCMGDVQEAKSLVRNTLEYGYFTLFLLEMELEGSNAGLNGFDVAEEIRSIPEYLNAPIIFFSSNLDGIQQAISDFHCYNYLVKPYNLDIIDGQIQEMLQTGYLTNNLLNITDISRVRHHILIKDICHVEALSHRVKISTVTEEFISRQIPFLSLKEILASELIPCHRKFLINVEHLVYYDIPRHKTKIHNEIIPVSRTYTKTLIDTLKL